MQTDTPVGWNPAEADRLAAEARLLLGAAAHDAESAPTVGLRDSCHRVLGDARELLDEALGQRDLAAVRGKAAWARHVADRVAEKLDRHRRLMMRSGTVVSSARAG